MPEVKIVTNSPQEVVLKGLLAPSAKPEAGQEIVQKGQRKSSPSYIETKKEVQGAEMNFTPEETKKLETLQSILTQSKEILDSAQTALQTTDVDDVPPQTKQEIKMYANIMMLIAKVCTNTMNNQGNLEYIHAQLMQQTQESLSSIQDQVGDLAKKIGNTTHKRGLKSTMFWVGIGLCAASALTPVGAGALAGKAVAMSMLGPAFVGIITGVGFAAYNDPNGETVDQSKLGKYQVDNSALSYSSETLNNTLQMFSRYIGNLADMTTQMSNYVQKAIELYGATMVINSSK
jgi:hypothetical protein